MKAIQGPQNRGLLEIRTGGYRTFYCVAGGVMWLLHGCKKQEQEAGIEVARQRRSPGTIRMACVEIRANASLPASQSA